MIQSVLEFWQNKREKLQGSDVKQYVSSCLKNLFDTNCMSSIGAPVDPHVVFGGFPDEEYENSTALVVTFLLNNWPENTTVAELWEKEFLKVVEKEYTRINIAYSAER